MEELENKKKLKKPEGYISKMLTGWLSKYISTNSEDEKRASLSKFTSALLKGGLSLASAFVFSRARSFGNTLPFGLSLLCASEKGAPWILSGVLLSNLRGEDRSIYFVSAMLIAVLRFVICYVLEGKSGKMFREPRALRLAVGAAGGFVCGIYRIFEGGFREKQLYEALFLICAVPLAAYLYSHALKDTPSGEGKREVGVFALYCTLLVGLNEFAFFGFSPSVVVASLITLGTALGSGAVKGGLSGMIGGLCCGGTLSPLMGIMGAAAGGLRRYSSLIAIGGACGCGVIFALISEGGMSLTATVPALLWGGAICLPVSRFGALSKINILSGRTVMSEDISNSTMLISKKEEAMQNRLNALSSAMTSLSGVFYALSNRLCTPGAWQVREICERSFKKYCSSCSKNALCWAREYDKTSDVMNKLASAVVRHGSADSSYIPSDFVSACPNTIKALSEINLSHARLLESAARQNKTEVFALDYEAMAKLLEEASEENSAEYILSAPLTERVREAAIDMGMGFNSIAVYGKRKKSVIAGGVELKGVRLSTEEMREAFSVACGVPLTTPEFKYDEDYVTMTATASRAISCESARASAKKENEKVNGDSALVFENREDRYYALISDGMGSGPDASMTSKMTGIFLEKLLSSGNKKHTVLKMLNNFIRHKNLECFATVDLLEIDLLSSEASFIKSGAAASYVIRNGRLFKIASASLPIGITREISSEEVRFKLENKDLIIMISDGVSQSFEDGAWLLSALSDEIDPDAPLTVISKTLLEKAKRKNERSDDMTVIAVRVSA